MIKTTYYIVEIDLDIDTNEPIYNYFRFESVEELNFAIENYNRQLNTFSAELLYVFKVDYLVSNIDKYFSFYKNYQEDFFCYLDQKVMNFSGFLINDIEDLHLNDINEHTLAALRLNIDDFLDLAYSFSVFEPIEGQNFNSFKEYESLKKLMISLCF